MRSPAQGVPWLRPFWRYFGGKWRAAPRYDAPKHNVIIEPFAGAAGYSLRHYWHDVILVEKYDVLFRIWDFLIRATSEEIMDIPAPIDDRTTLNRSLYPEAVYDLIGMRLAAAAATPRDRISAGMRRFRDDLKLKSQGWGEDIRLRIADQVQYIKHWRVYQGDYCIADTNDDRVTWFIDPPYQIAGKTYRHHGMDYRALGAWCRARNGQVIVCENEGADWLEFQSVPWSTGSMVNGMHGGKRSQEAWWRNEP